MLIELPTSMLRRRFNWRRPALHIPDNYQKIPITGLTEWVAALRSANYQQGRGSLYVNNEGYCCLGVKCALEYKKTPSCGTFYGSKVAYYGNCGLNSAGTLPGCWIYYLDSGLRMTNTPYPSLTDLNDQGIPFTVIADIIEACFCEKE